MTRSASTPPVPDLTPTLLLLLAAGGAAGCTIEPIPFSITSREMVLPYLTRQCLEAVVERPRVELVSAGAPPQRRLRLHAAAGRAAQIRVLLPPRFEGGDYLVDTEWIDVGVSGQGCHEFEVSGPKTAHIGDPVVGVAGVAASGATAFMTDALDAKSFAVERDLFWLLDRTDPVLPDEPIGVGATWHLSTEGMRAGELLESSVSYRLAKIDGSAVTLEVVRTVHRPAQRIQDPLGKSHKVKEMTIREVGVLDFDLRRRPFPNARFWDDKGNEVLRVAVAYSD
jgi:hypothetical protein